MSGRTGDQPAKVKPAGDVTVILPLSNAEPYNPEIVMLELELVPSDTVPPLASNKSVIFFLS